MFISGVCYTLLAGDRFEDNIVAQGWGYWGAVAVLAAVSVVVEIIAKKRKTSEGK
jgi:hypothetical protein